MWSASVVGNGGRVISGAELVEPTDELLATRQVVLGHVSRSWRLRSIIAPLPPP